MVSTICQSVVKQGLQLYMLINQSF